MHMYWGYELKSFLLVEVQNQSNLETTAVADGKSVFFFSPYLPPDYGPAKFIPLQIQPPPSFQTPCNKMNPSGNLAEHTTTSPTEDINAGVWLKGKPACSLPHQCS